MLFNRKKETKQQPVQVAVIDDEEDLCRCIRWALDQHHITSAEAHDGESGMQLIRNARPQIILLDIMMPRKNGYQVLTELQRDPVLGKIPVFILTSLNDGSGKSDEEWAGSLGVSHFISKPFDPDDLARRLADQLKDGSLASSD